MKNCIDSWRRFCPDYEIKKWDETNSPLELPYLTKAYKNSKWANMSNFVRLFAVFQEGGLYFDTDVEVVKNFDVFLNNHCFFGFETKKYVSNAIFGAEKKSPFIKELMDNLIIQFDGTELANLSSPILVTELLRQKGLKKYSRKPFALEKISLFPIHFFYPLPYKKRNDLNFIRKRKYLKKDSHCIHYWALRW